MKYRVILITTTDCNGTATAGIVASIKPETDSTSYTTSIRCLSDAVVNHHHAGIAWKILHFM